MKKLREVFFLTDQQDGSFTFLTKSIIFAAIIISPKRKHKLESWLIGCWHVLESSKKNDIIVCWFDFQAVLCYWICKLCFIKRKIVCINIMLKDKNTLRNKIVSFLYLKALQSGNFIASVTSKEYGKWLNEKLCIKQKYTLIHDVYHEDYNYHFNKKIILNSVFCGGRNGRDWNFIINLARCMPNITFNLVMPKVDCVNLRYSLSKNIVLKCDISYKCFIEEICKSEIIALPIDTQAPAGLIVLFQAAANNKIVVTTKTATSSEYINKERGYILPNEINVWKNTINSILANKQENLRKANNFHIYLKENCSEKLFTEGVEKMINSLEN